MKTTFFKFPLTTTHLGQNPRYAELKNNLNSSKVDEDMNADGFFYVENINADMMPIFLQDWYTYKLPTPEPKATPLLALNAFISESVTNGCLIRGLKSVYLVDPADSVPVGMEWSTKTDEDGTVSQITFAEYGTTQIGSDFYVTTWTKTTGKKFGDATFFMSNTDMKLMIESGHTNFLNIPTQPE